jgi:hypothetical protein
LIFDAGGIGDVGLDDTPFDLFKHILSVSVLYDEILSPENFGVRIWLWL